MLDVKNNRTKNTLNHDWRKDMKEKIGTKSLKNLELNKTYKVEYAGFKKASGSRGDFMSVSMLISNDKGEKVWVNSLNERMAYKIIGILTYARVNGNKVSITGIRHIKNNNYDEVELDINEYIPEVNLDEYEPIDF